MPEKLNLAELRKNIKTATTIREPTRILLHQLLDLIEQKDAALRDIQELKVETSCFLYARRIAGEALALTTSSDVQASDE